MKYLKHYWISNVDGGYCCHENTSERRHPEVEFPGLNVKIWLCDESGIDLCLSEVPDTTEVFDIFDAHDPNLKVVQVLTEEQFYSVSNPLNEANDLIMQSRNEKDPTLSESFYQQALTKRQEAMNALNAF